MKKLLSFTLLSAFLLALTGCADELVYSRGPHARRGYHDDRRTTTYYENRPVYQGERRMYRNDGYYGRSHVREYDAPRQSHTDVRVTF